MFHHVKELQFNARVSEPDPRFASLLMEQFGGANGELTAALQYFTQSFALRQPHPQVYDMMMDIAIEEFSHLEVVGATIQMLLGDMNADLKAAADENEVVQLARGDMDRDALIHQASMMKEFMTLMGGGLNWLNPSGVPWTGAYVSSQADPTVDLRSDIAAESRAKIVYEYLLQLTDDPLVKESLTFLMTREVAHFQMFAAALETFQPNFPPGVLQGDPAYTHTAFNFSDGASVRGPWNEGQGPWPDGQKWEYVEEPLREVVATEGQIKKTPPDGAGMTPAEAETLSRELSKVRGTQIKESIPRGANQWSSYPQEDVTSPRAVSK